MNTYYLKKFRRMAKKHVKAEIYKDKYNEYIIIATNDYTHKLTRKILNLIPNNILGWLFPKGILLRKKLYYAKCDYCQYFLDDEPLKAEVINDLTRNKQIMAIQDARRLYILNLVSNKRDMEDIYVSRLRMIENKRKIQKITHELNKL